MSYVRKTEDEYEVQQYSGPQYGWEMVTTETTWKEARARLREYRQELPGVYRVVKKRVKKETTERSVTQ